MTIGGFEFVSSGVYKTLYFVSRSYWHSHFSLRKTKEYATILPPCHNKNGPSQRTFITEWEFLLVFTCVKGNLCLSEGYFQLQTCTGNSSVSRSRSLVHAGR